MQRGAVFFDYQNCYNRARDAFHSSNDPSRLGNFHLGSMAELLLAKGGADRELVHVGVYTGSPDPRRDPKAHRAHEKRTAAWRAECGPKLAIRQRTLNYRGWPKERPREKGIDVQLAIDAMLGAVGGLFDVVVIATADTDLLPVVEGLLQLQTQTGAPDAEVIAWAGLKVGLQVANVPIRWIGPRDYQAVRDDRDYNL